MKSSTRRQRVGTALLGVFGLFAATLMGEGLLRLADHVRPFMGRYVLPDPDPVYASHPTLNHTLAPSLDYLRPASSESPIPAYRLRTNKAGFRVFVPEAKPPGVIRIAVLGDSVIEGYGEQYTLPALLERALSGERSRVEVLNFGCTSYSPLLHLANLKNVLKYDPDLLLLYFDMTDVFDDNVRYRPVAVWDDQGALLRVRPTMEFALTTQGGRAVSVLREGRRLVLARPIYSPSRLRTEILRHSYLARVYWYKVHGVEGLVRSYVAAYAEAHPDLAVRAPISLAHIHDWCYAYETPETQEQVRYSLSIVRQIFTLTRQTGVRPVLLALPIRAQLPGVSRVASLAPLRRLESFAGEMDAPFFCPEREFAERAARGETLYFDGIHPVYDANRVWADALAAWLRARGLVASKARRPPV